MAPHLPLTTQLSLKTITPTLFETHHPPQKMGNPLNIAYGGYALALACKAAHLCVPTGYYMYSMQGNYLGPAYTDRVLRARVREVRQTRTFGTRIVEISQKTDRKGGKEEEEEERVCLIAFVDFMVASPSSSGKEDEELLSYSQQPTHQYPPWSNCPTQQETFQALMDQGKVSKELVQYHSEGFSLLRDLYTQRLPPDTLFGKNLYGLAKQLVNGQQHIPSAQRTTADYFRAKENLTSHIDHVTNLVFALDTAIAFLPLSFNNLWFDDVAAVSSLDFSLRFFTKDVDVNQWLLRELRAPVAGEGRSFGEAWVWDEQGRAVCTMSQQSILRPRKKAMGKL